MDISKCIAVLIQLHKLTSGILLRFGDVMLTGETTSSQTKLLKFVTHLITRLISIIIKVVQCIAQVNLLIYQKQFNPFQLTFKK